MQFCVIPRLIKDGEVDVEEVGALSQAANAEGNAKAENEREEV